MTPIANTSLRGSPRTPTTCSGAIQAGDEARASQATLAHLPAGSTGFSEFLATVPMSFFEDEKEQP